MIDAVEGMVDLAKGPVKPEIWVSLNFRRKREKEVDGK